MGQLEQREHQLADYAGPKRVLYRFLLIGLGIPVALVTTESLIHLIHPLRRLSVSSALLNLVILGLVGFAIIIWFFFSRLLYRRLWDLFDNLKGDHDIWSYAEGSFGFVGVGISLSSALGLLYYLVSGDYLRSIVLHALALALFVVEILSFSSRMDKVRSKLE